MNMWDQTNAFKRYAMKLLLIYYRNEIMELRFYYLISSQNKTLNALFVMTLFDLKNLVQHIERCVKRIHVCSNKRLRPSRGDNSGIMELQMSPSPKETF